MVFGSRLISPVTIHTIPGKVMAKELHSGVSRLDAVVPIGIEFLQ
jgi:hypothetical protein